VQPKSVPRSATPSPSPIEQTAAVSITIVPADHVAAVLRGMFPNAKLSVDHAANAVIIMARPDDMQQIRALIQSLDVQSPTKLQTDAIS
jgi:type II secretory pathway component GspD/PulD (secretin)